MLPIPMFFQQAAPAAAAPGGGDMLMSLLLPVGIVVIVAIILLLRRRQGGPISGRSTGNPRLRVAGGVLIAVGLGWLILTLQMDVSVSSCDTNVSGIGDFGDRMDAVARGARCLLDEYQGSRPQVINIGLLSEKNNSLLLAGLTVLAGVVLLAVSFNRGRTNSEAPKPIEGRGFTASANAWRETQASLQPEQYNDFLEAFRGTPEALLAAKHKRILQDWDGLNKTDGATVEAFLTNDLFPAMKQRVRQFIADEAGRSVLLGALHQRLLLEEAEAQRIASEEADRAEAAKLEQSRRKEAERVERARREKQTIRRGLIGIAVGVAAIAAIVVSPSILSALEEQRVKVKQAEEAALSALEEQRVKVKQAEEAAAVTERVRALERNMIRVPGGAFPMGSPQAERGRSSNEGPQRSVSIQPFEVSKHEVTWAQYEACVSVGSCIAVSDDGFGKGDRPVTSVSWDDASKFVSWLSRETGKSYRLLSEAEWEYAARAGTMTAYSFGDSISNSQANYGGGLSGTTPVGSYPANAFGLHDFHGNVTEWVQDCYADNYSAGQPSDGSAYTSGYCGNRVVRGGSWRGSTEFLRSAFRYWSGQQNRDISRGFRVARTL